MNLLRKVDSSEGREKDGASVHRIRVHGGSVPRLPPRRITATRPAAYLEDGDDVVILQARDHYS